MVATQQVWIDGHGPSVVELRSSNGRLGIQVVANKDGAAAVFDPTYGREEGESTC